MYKHMQWVYDIGAESRDETIRGTSWCPGVNSIETAQQ